MALKLESNNGGISPVAVCDKCGYKIEKGGSAICLTGLVSSLTSVAEFVHDGNCFESAINELNSHAASYQDVIVQSLSDFIAGLFEVFVKE